MERLRGGYVMLLPQCDVFPGHVYGRGWTIHFGWLLWKVGVFFATDTERAMKAAQRQRARVAK
jgi:hypothetical protein